MPTLDVGQGEARIYGYGEISQPCLFLNRMFLFLGGIAAADARALLDRAIGVCCSLCLTAGREEPRLPFPGEEGVARGANGGGRGNAIALDCAR